MRLAKAEVKRSPKADSDKPCIEQQASGVMRSIRRLGKCNSAGRPNPTGLPTDAHLRSCSAIIGHRVADGTIGLLLIERNFQLPKLFVGWMFHVNPSRRSGPDWHKTGIQTEAVASKLLYLL